MPLLEKKAKPAAAAKPAATAAEGATETKGGFDPECAAKIKALPTPKAAFPNMIKMAQNK